jgi:hypothetical protein
LEGFNFSEGSHVILKNVLPVWHWKSRHSIDIINEDGPKNNSENIITNTAYLEFGRQGLPWQ